MSPLEQNGGAHCPWLYRERMPDKGVLHMQVTVRFLGALCDQAGRQSVVVDLSAEATYRDLLDRIAAEMESSLAHWAWDADRRSFSYRTMTLRNSSTQLREDSTKLADGDEIVVLVPLAGG